MDLHEPLVTWNLFLTPLAVALSTGIIMLFVTRMFNMRDRKDEEIAKLIVKANDERESRIKEVERLREENVQQYRANSAAVQCKIKEALQRIEVKLELKVDKPDCQRETADKWDAINHIRDHLNKGGKFTGGV